MSVPVAIIGTSGSGKTASLRNMDPASTLLIQALEKPLPFPNAKLWRKFDAKTKTGNVVVCNDVNAAGDIQTLLNATKRKIIVIDDFQYVMANEFMRRAYEKGYEKFTEIGRHAWDIIINAGQLAEDVRVYFLSHTEESESGVSKMKTIGKMLDEKITVEGMFTVVLGSVVRDGEYLFTTHNSGRDKTKSPMGMFEEDMIPNDLRAVDKRICEYYGLAS